ncbi:MAG: flagellar hook-associated protein FlgL [Xanthomonadales bacterium]|nr:flagellar hook-associated protein FlgL [Xanthomonadales bacterium]
MRISTNLQFTQSLNALLARQAESFKTQLQLSTGQKINTASQDPVGAGSIVQLDRARAELERFGANSNVLANRLNLAEVALTATGDRLLRVRELAVQGFNGTQNAESRSAIADELEQQLEALYALSNSDDGSGRYLFAGSQGSAIPFTPGPTGVIYAGDQVQRRVDVSPSLSVADVAPGSEIFLRVPTGNGTFAARPDAANAGTLILDSAGLSGSTPWVPDNYRITFDGAGGYSVQDGASTVIATGTYTAGQAIEFGGAQLRFSGVPAAGDSFTVQPSARQDMFATVQGVIDALRMPSTTPPERAAQRNAFFASLEDLGVAQDQIIDARSKVGAGLNTLDRTTEERASQVLSLSTTLSEIRDVNYAEAASRLSQQLLMLEAAQATFTKVQGNSLFNFIR